MAGRVASDDAGRREEASASGTEDLFSDQGCAEIGRKGRKDGNTSGMRVCVCVCARPA